jgi:hypothetical protein
MPETQSTIVAGGDVLTLIDVFTCPEERQNELVAALDKATAEVLRHQRGFIAASIHASLDRTRVVNYAQWATVEDFDAMRDVPAVEDQRAQIMAIAESADPRLFVVRAVHHA